ncbi:MAG: peptide chain release factor N(5)-glutamine methyltransferase [Treponema sp.]|nr:peptide chain release factor N(5)-glutamine methyltransferase [Treponema sp.]
MDIAAARRWGREQLPQSPSPELDADCLLCCILQCDKSFLLFHRETVLDSGAEQTFRAYIAARRTGLPVAYITGHKEFYGYDFAVTPDVLIPKPDTELLVENALAVIREKAAAAPARILTVCDMCTGSGCVGLSVLRACADSGIVPPAALPAFTLADISAGALSVARQNLQAVPDAAVRGRVKLVRSNLFQNVAGCFDLILANPPYIPAEEVAVLLQDGRSEPPLALNGDVDSLGNPTHDGDGLGVMRSLVPQAAAHLAPGGVLIVEAGEYNAEMTEYLFRAAGLSSTRIHRDLSGQLRDISGIKSR